MTLRITIGIDPGLTGAVAVLADGIAVGCEDMPTRKVGDWREIDAQGLTCLIRQIRGAAPGAWIEACVEKVGARPGDGGTSAFRFGESYGRICGVLESLGITYSRVVPVQWKRHYALLGTDKDAARLLAIKRFPETSALLTRKKDNGRADALLMALWHESTQQRGARAA